MANAPGRVLRIALVLSLALNLVVIGIFAGAMLRFRDGGPPPRVDFSLGPLGRALEPEDRRAILRALRSREDLRAGGPRAWRADLEKIAVLIAADPFEPEALKAHLSGLRDEGAALIAAAQEAAVDRIGTMTFAERAALAERVRAEGAGQRRRDRDGTRAED